MFEQQEIGMVDAIEDGRIVRVREEYARREGLMIIRKHEKSVMESPKLQKEMKLTPRLKGERKAYFDIEKYRRPWNDKNEILNTLIDNFHWEISARRKELNLTRKQLANSINAIEEEIKMLENRNLPQSDYILISKLENYLKINLRKNKNMGNAQSYGTREHTIHKPRWVDKIGKSKDGSDASASDLVSSDEIEIIDESDDDEDK